MLQLKKAHLLGHSWGTMLAASYLLERKPLGVRSVIFSSPRLSADLWKKDADRLKAALTGEFQQTITRCEAQGTTDSAEYQAAMKEYYKRYVCRLDPRPTILEINKAKSNLEVYETMWGPSEFFPKGFRHLHKGKLLT
jgi:proline iminopeptidase